MPHATPDDPLQYSVKLDFPKVETRRLLVDFVEMGLDFLTGKEGPDHFMYLSTGTSSLTHITSVRLTTNPLVRLPKIRSVVTAPEDVSPTVPVVSTVTESFFTTFYLVGYQIPRYRGLWESGPFGSVNYRDV